MSRKTGKKKRVSSGYIMKDFRVSKELYKAIWSLTEDLDLKCGPDGEESVRQKYHHFISHVFASGRIKWLDKENLLKPIRRVPVDSRKIEEKFGRVLKTRLLMKAGIIEIKPHSTYRKKSREFRLADEAMQKIIKFAYGELIASWRSLIREGYNSQQVNLFNGRKKKSRCRNVKSTNEIRRPQLIVDSMESLVPCPFNPHLIVKWVEKLEEILNAKAVKLNRVKRKFPPHHPKYKIADRQYRQAFGKYLNPILAMETILGQKPHKLDVKGKNGEVLLAYQAAYKIQISGRITERYGGFQNLKRALKWLLLKNVEGIYNCDLKASQATILLHELKQCKIKHHWLEHYLNNQKAKRIYADKTGVSEDVWKKCFYSTIMGADPYNHFGAVFKAIQNYHDGDYDKAKETHQKFLDIARDLIESCDKWRDYLFSTEDPRYTYRHNKIKYWHNACEMRFKEFGKVDDIDGKAAVVRKEDKEKAITNLNTIKEVKRRLAAFILQGKEAFFIHTLTALAAQNGIPIYKNEHDGLITGKPIPKEIIEEVMQTTNMEDMELVEKPLCPIEARHEFRNYIKENKP